ncbi:MAG: hypothetical protein IT379_37930 [Deltaproteobacteria bacterium]|nr:hypothetical protein [Deltaproteobacteria bacterium]
MAPIHRATIPRLSPVAPVGLAIPRARGADTYYLETVATELLSHPVDGALAASIVSSHLDSIASPRDRRTLANALDLFANVASGGKCAAAALPWWRLQPFMVVVVRREIADQSCAPSTLRRVLSSCREVFRRCHQRGLINDATLRDLVDASRHPEPPRAATVLSADQCAALLATCAGPDMVDLRDGAVLALLLAKLKPAEVIALNLQDWDGSRRTLRVQGSRARTITPSGHHADFLYAWVARRGPLPGPLILPLLRGGRPAKPRRMSQDTLRSIVHTRCLRAGLPRLSPRDLRRTALARAVADGWSPTEVAASAGLYDAKGLRAHRRHDRDRKTQG